jgi:hypothetical protein
MKPLSEFLKELQEKAEPPVTRGYRNGILDTVDLLQVWLREADGFLEPEKVVTVFPSENERSMDVSKFVSRIRQKLLGTTRTEGEK